MGGRTSNISMVVCDELVRMRRRTCGNDILTCIAHSKEHRPESLLLEPQPRVHRLFESFDGTFLRHAEFIQQEGNISSVHLWGCHWHHKFIVMAWTSAGRAWSGLVNYDTGYQMPHPSNVPCPRAHEKAHTLTKLSWRLLELHVKKLQHQVGMLQCNIWYNGANDYSVDIWYVASEFAEPLESITAFSNNTV